MPVEQKRCKCAGASESGGKQGWQSRQGVKADWEEAEKTPARGGGGMGGGREGGREKTQRVGEG